MGGWSLLLMMINPEYPWMYLLGPIETLALIDYIDGEIDHLVVPLL